MQICYLILAHARPRQFGRLVGLLLENGRDGVVVHVDKTADQSEFERAVRGYEQSVHFVPRRYNIKWGGFESSEATLEMMRVAAGRGAGYHVLLSGQDYPIRPLAELRRELELNAIHMEVVPSSHEFTRPHARLAKLGVATKDRNSAWRRGANAVLRVLPPRDVTRGLAGRRPYGGSQWWALPGDVAESVLAFVDANPRFMRFYSRSLHADESMFQTIVAEVAGDRDIREQLTWADWWKPVRQLPVTLTTGDLGSLTRAAQDGYFFARKFDATLDEHVLDLVEKELLNR